LDHSLGDTIKGRNWPHYVWPLVDQDPVDRLIDLIDLIGAENCWIGKFVAKELTHNAVAAIKIYISISVGFVSQSSN
jgi:hypothetical protein